MSEIKHKITNLLNRIENDEVQYNELKYIQDYILKNSVNKEESFLFFDLLHFSDTSKMLSNHNLSLIHISEPTRRRGIGGGGGGG